VTSKSSNSDNYLTDFFLTRMMYNEPYAETTMEISGLFQDKNLDASEMSAPYVATRRNIAEEITRDGKKIWRYELCCGVNVGLAKQDIPLPANVPIQLCFNRAAAAKSLLQIKDKDNGNTTLVYEDRTVPILSPVLSVYFVESVSADGFYSKARLYDISVPFFDYNIRRELLIDKVSEHRVKISEGPLPHSLVIGLLKPSVFDGDLKRSTFKFTPNDLESVDLQVDNQSLTGYPLTMKSTNGIEFYLNYLKVTNRYENVFSSGAVSYSNFMKYNFLIYVNFRDENLTNGQAILKLKFATELSEKLYLVFMPLYERSVTYDSFFNAAVETVNKN